MYDKEFNNWEHEKLQDALQRVQDRIHVLRMQASSYADFKGLALLDEIEQAIGGVNV